MVMSSCDTDTFLCHFRNLLSNTALCILAIFVLPTL